MDRLKQIWDWLKQPEIAGAVAAITAVAGVAWAVYTHFSGSAPLPSEITNITASGGSIAAKDITATASENGMAVVAGGNVTIERDPRVAKALETQEQQLKKADLREQEYQDTIKALREAVTALAKKKELPNAPPGIDWALEQLAEGNAAAAETIFRDVAEKKEAEGKAANQEAAEALRHLGALAFLHDTNKALDAYRRSTELDPENAEGWNQLGHLLLRKGELQSAESAYRKVAELSESSSDRVLLAVAYGNLGIVYRIRGELDQAVAMHNKALAINEALGRKAGMASQYGNLGNVYEIRGELDQAEAMYKKSLAIDEALGRKMGMAVAYGNLGIIYQTRGELDQAVAMHNKALAINEALGCKEGMASQYGNLGIVYKIRGELDQAEAMYKKSLAIEEALGRKTGMASDYTNLGNVYRTRGELDQAEAMYNKALVLFQTVGATAQVKQTQGLLDNLKKP